MLKYDHTRAHKRIKLLTKDGKGQVMFWEGCCYIQAVGCFGTESIGQLCFRLLSYTAGLTHLTCNADWFVFEYAKASRTLLELGSF